MMLRWTLWAPGRGEEPLFKVLVHHFPAEISDRDPHDHPRSFVTFVLRGNYRDKRWEVLNKGARPEDTKIGRVVEERVCAGAVKYRPASYIHIVETDAVGSWTLVVMGPLRREWGFLRLVPDSFGEKAQHWWPWRQYIERFGGVIRCEAEPDRMDIPLDAREGETVRLKTGERFDGALAVVREHQGNGIAMVEVEGAGLMRAFTSDFRHPRTARDYKGTGHPENT